MILTSAIVTDIGCTASRNRLKTNLRIVYKTKADKLISLLTTRKLQCINFVVAFYRFISKHTVFKGRRSHRLLRRRRRNVVCLKGNVTRCFMGVEIPYGAIIRRPNNVVAFLAYYRRINGIAVKIIFRYGVAVVNKFNGYFIYQIFGKSVCQSCILGNCVLRNFCHGYARARCRVHVCAVCRLHVAYRNKLCAVVSFGNAIHVRRRLHKAIRCRVIPITRSKNGQCVFRRYGQITIVQQFRQEQRTRLVARAKLCIHFIAHKRVETDTHAILIIDCSNTYARYVEVINTATGNRCRICRRCAQSKTRAYAKRTRRCKSKQEKFLHVFSSHNSFPPYSNTFQPSFPSPHITPLSASGLPHNTSSSLIAMKEISNALYLPLFVTFLLSSFIKKPPQLIIFYFIKFSSFFISASTSSTGIVAKPI